MISIKLLIFVSVMVSGIVAHHHGHHHGHGHGHHHHHHHHNDSNCEDPCPASESLRRTTHYICHGYSDGNDIDNQNFINCTQSSKYKLYDGLDKCGHLLNLTFAMDNLTEARKTICSIHDDVHLGNHEPWKESYPLFDCLINFYANQTDCELTGCKAKLYVTDELDYEILKCYQSVYNRFPEKFDCDD